MDSDQQVDPMVLTCLRNDFYRRKFHFAFGVCVLGLAVIGMLIFMLHLLLKHPSHPYYFATDDAGRLLPDISITKPNLTQAEVVAWTVDAIEAAYTYDYVNFRAQLQDAQKYFTDYGWKSYMKGLNASNNLIALTSRKMTVVAKIVSPPKLLGDGPLGNQGAYAWKFEMPVLVTYQTPPYDAKSRFVNPLIVTVIVQRQPVMTSFKGLGIVQLIGELAQGAAGQSLTAPS